MYGPTDLKKNTLITLDGQPYKVIEYSQKVMGRGGSIVNVRVKNLITGALIPKTFKGQEKIEPAEVSTKKVQYLYRDEEKFYFMDPTTFEQYELSSDMVGDSKDFMKDDGHMCIDNDLCQQMKAHRLETFPLLYSILESDNSLQSFILKSEKRFSL